jgi:hypothetical protein
MITKNQAFIFLCFTTNVRETVMIVTESGIHMELVTNYAN